MKIGILSDIHGDYTALETAIERLDTLHGVDHILCAGDLVGRGPEPERVVQAVRERGILTVRGNHDEWSYGMSPESKTYLKGLPLDWRGSLGGIITLYRSGSVMCCMDGLFRHRHLYFAPCPCRCRFQRLSRTLFFRIFFLKYL